MNREDQRESLSSGRSKNEPRFVFVTGGVVSSLGKGIAAASLGLLLKNRGLKVTLQKLDPYLNVDPGTMSPYQHGEVFVTDDGAETDLDLGHYERFTDVSLAKENSVSAGQIYDTIISRERRGDYLGKTVQVIPHVTDEIKRRVLQTITSTGADVAIIEIGGTVGDIESLPFLEAIRQFRLDLGPRRTFFVHVTLVPYVRAAQELKTKPTQHSVRELREIGIQPDVLLCRSEVAIPTELRDKIALFCNVPASAVIEAPDVRSIYEVPLGLHRGGLDALVLDLLEFGDLPDVDLAHWDETVRTILRPSEKVRIAICGKYTHLQDAYKSISEAFIHAGAANEVQVEIEWLESTQFESGDHDRILQTVDGILVPGGFGERGIEGMVQVISYAREHRIPFFGICLGLHCAAIEIARHLCGLEKANSTEFDSEAAHPVIDLMPDQKTKTAKGGTMRLGAYKCDLSAGSLARQAYASEQVSERHRHRWEFNDKYRPVFDEAGVRFTGVCPDNGLVEILELTGHPWFLAVQFHPELKSRPERPHPLFRSFVAAAARHHEDRHPRDKSRLSEESHDTVNRKGATHA